jgi:hypothetical protein
LYGKKIIQMSNDRVTKVVTYTQSGTVMDCPGYDISNTEGATFSAYSTGLCKVTALVSDGIQGASTYTVGGVQLDSPVGFGGIAVDNSATGGPTVISGVWGVTTRVPLQQTGIVDHVFVAGSGVIKVKFYNSGLVCDDPTGLYKLLGGAQVNFIRGLLAPPTKVTIIPDSGATLWIGNVGDEITDNGVTLPAGAVYEAGDGQNPLAPFAVYSTLDYSVILEY